MKIGILNKDTNKTEYIYSYSRYKTFPEYSSSNYIQYEITESTDERAYSFNNNSIIFDNEWIAPTEDISVVVTKKVTDAMQFGQEMTLEFAKDNVLMGITQLGKTSDILSLMTERVLLDGKVRPISLMDAMSSGSLYEAIHLIDYHIDNMASYTDLAPFITTERLTTFKGKLEEFLGL